VRQAKTGQHSDHCRAGIGGFFKGEKMASEYCENDCDHCLGDGFIEQDNNGPIVNCPVCEGTGIIEIEIEDDRDPDDKYH
jgi:DnaJ-class molecular chaperone